MLLPRAILLISLALCAGGCGMPPAPEQPVQAWSGDVVSIDTVALDNAPFAQAELQVSIGEAAGPEEDQFQQVSGVDVAPNGNIFVLDVYAAEVRVYDAGGALVRQFGGKGHGPGELQNIRDIAIGNDTVFIVDMELQMFDTAGSFLGRVQSDRHPFASVPRIEHTAAGLLVGKPEFTGERAGEVTTTHHRMFDPATRTTSPPFILDSVRYFRLARGVYGAGVLGGIPVLAAAPDGRIFRSIGDSFHVAVHEPGSGRVTNHVAPIARVPTTRSDFDDYVLTYDRVEPDHSPGIMALRNAPRARLRPVIRALIASESMLLVQRADRGRPYALYDTTAAATWNLLDPDMKPVARLELPLLFKPHAFRRCSLTGVFRDADGVTSVRQYRLPSSVCNDGPN